MRPASRHLLLVLFVVGPVGYGCAGRTGEGEEAANHFAAMPYERDALLDALARIEAWLRTHRPDEATALRPGLPEAEIRARAAALPFTLPQEVVDLYAWHDGSNSWGTFVEYHRFPPLDDVVRTYAEQMEARAAFPHLWTPSWLPLFAFQEEFFFLDVGSQIGGAASASLPVWKWLLEDPDPVIRYPSLQTMMQVWAEAYERGVVTLHPEYGEVVYDEEEIAAIRRRLAPGR